MTLDQVERCFNILMRDIRTRGVTAVELGERDFYWTITPADSLQIYKQPEPAVGSFVDDEAELKKLLADPLRASAVDLDRLASLLKLLSDSLVA